MNRNAGYLEKYLGTLEKELYYSQDLYKRRTDRKRDCEKSQKSVIFDHVVEAPRVLSLQVGRKLETHCYLGPLFSGTISDAQSQCSEPSIKMSR